MEGTVRTQNPETRIQVSEYLKQLAVGTAYAMGAEAEVEYDFGYPPTMNDPKVIDWISEAVTEILGPERLLQVPVSSMGSEDFSFYLEKVPGALFRIGTYDETPESKWALHNPAIIFNEQAILTGIAGMVSSVFKISGSDMNVLKG